MPETTQKQYLFVSSSGNARSPNDSVRRAHVMQHRFSPSSKVRSGLQVVQTGPASGKFTFQLSNHATTQLAYTQGRKDHDTSALIPAAQTETVADASLAQDAIQVETSRHEAIARVLEDGLQIGFNSTDTTRDGNALPDPTTEKLLKVEEISEDERVGLLRLSTSPLLFFGTARIDPLGVLPFQLTAWDEGLLDRFSHNKKWPWCPVSGQSLWSPFAMSDEMLFSATMYSWSMAFRNRLTGSEATSWLENNPQVLGHKVRAISLINRNLSDASTSLKDVTIAAIAAMANLELVFGTYETASQHINGLRRLMFLRGGFNLKSATPIQQLIYRLVSWTGLIYSNIYHAPLYFPALELWDMSWRTIDSLALPGSPLCFSPLELQSVGIGNYEIIDILQSIRRLCYLEQRWPLHEIDEHDRMLRADVCSDLEMRLTKIIRSFEHDSVVLSGSNRSDTAVQIDCETHLHTEKPSSWNYALWRSTALAAQIYTHHFLRGVALSQPQYRTWARSLRASLDQTYPAAHLDRGGPQQQFSFSRSLLLWTLSIGALASARQLNELSLNRSIANESDRARVGAMTYLNDHDFFLSELVRAKLRFDIERLDYIAALQGFFWTGSKDEPRYSEVWYETLAWKIQNEM